MRSVVPVSVQRVDKSNWLSGELWDDWFAISVSGNRITAR